ncbi:MAG: hypothetical protein AAGE94_06690 [Acidobacteriota bacterium]
MDVMDAVSDTTTFDDLVPEADADELLDDEHDPFGIGAEYSVFAFEVSALTVAYLAFFAIFAWFRVFYWLWHDGSWAVAMVGGYVIAISGTVAAWRARRRRRSFAALVALLLDGGLVLALVVPTLGFLVVRYL